MRTGEFTLMGTVLSAFLLGCGGPRMEKLRTSGDTIELTVNGKRIQAELALDDPSRTRGLMYREKMPEDQGMLFVWPQARQLSIWMKNTSIPLSVAFISDTGEILQIEDLRPHDERQVRSKDELRYALEMNQGWFQRNGVGTGAVFEDFRKGAGGLRSR